MDTGQILWAASYPYLQTIFFFQNFQFKIFYHFFVLSLTWEPMGSTISKRYSSDSYRCAYLRQTLR